VLEHATRLKELEAQLEAAAGSRGHSKGYPGAAPAPKRPLVLPGVMTSARRSIEGDGPSRDSGASPVRGAGVGSLSPGGAETPERRRDSATPPRRGSSDPTTPPGDKKQSTVLQDSGDPYDRMWSAAKLHRTRIFDQDLLKSIYNKPHKDLRNQAAMVGSGVVGLLSMPFGPIGMAAGGMFGAVVGGLVGHCVDRRRRQKKIEESELEKKRLKSLVRWAAQRFHDDDEVLNLIEMVILEFKPMADIATGSKNARKQLKVLDKWVAQKSVKRQLWAYMDHLLQHWQDLNRGEFIRSMLVFQTLTTMYRYSTRVLEEEETQFVNRMERLLEHGSVKSVMSHAQQFPTHGETRVMECMVYADHASLLTRRLTNLTAMTSMRSGGDSEGATRSPREIRATVNTKKSRRGSAEAASADPAGNMEDDLEAAGSDGDDSDNDRLEDYKLQSSQQGLLIAPMAEAGNASAFPARQPTKVLKKPFFRSWDDFMEFDIAFKHKMPVTLSEFDLLLEKEQESSVGWDVCVDRKEIRVAKVQNANGVITLRAWATVHGVDMNVAFYLFYNFRERVKWDKVFANMDLLGDGSHGSDMLYSMLKVPGVTSRDFLQFRRVRLQDDGSIAIVLRSAEHPDCPESKNAIRAESYIGGYVLRQEYEDGIPVLKLFIMSCSDIKGLIPKWIINMVAPKKPAEWVEVLRKACIEYQESHSGYKAELEKYLDSFRKENPFDYEAEPAGAGAAMSAQADLHQAPANGFTNARAAGHDKICL